MSLSAKQLSHPGLVRAVEGILEETGLDPGRLAFEATEGVETPEQAVRLREHGRELAQGHHLSAPLSDERL